jgi:fucose permease
MHAVAEASGTMTKQSTVEEAQSGLRPGRLFFAASAGMSVFGIVVALLGTLFGLPEMRVRLGMNLAQQGDLFSLLFVGLLVATVAVGPTIDRFGNKLVLLVSSALVTLALIGFAAAESYRAAGLAIVLLGFGGGGLNTATNVVVSDVYPEDRGRMLNLLGIFFGVGALFIPLVAASIFGLFSIPGLMLLAAAGSASCVLLYAVFTFPPPREAASFSMREVVRSARYPGVALFAALCFLQSGNEACISGWTSTYIGCAGWSPRTATWILAGYWVTMMCGRLLSSRAVAWMGKPRLVLLSACAGATGCALLLAARSMPVLLAGVALAGVSFAPIYPTTLAIVGDRYQRFAGTVFGLLFSVGIVGGMVFPWTLGHVSQDFGVRAGMALPLGGAIAIAIVAAIISRRAPDGRLG